MMIRVYASGVKDLTVARYFAAMNIDLIGFVIDQENKKTIKEIIDWIEGPKIVLEIEDADFLEEASIDVNAHFIYLSEEEEWHPGKLYTNEKYPSFISIEDGSMLETLRISDEYDNYFLIDNVNSSTLEKLEGINSGLMLIAGEEDEVGIKSFDQLDEIFDLIEEYNS